jgi:hypothetical protein
MTFIFKWSSRYRYVGGWVGRQVGRQSDRDVQPTEPGKQNVEKVRVEYRKYLEIQYSYRNIPKKFTTVPFTHVTTLLIFP